MPLPDWDELARQRMMHALNRARHHVARRIYRGERLVADEFTVEQARRDQRPGSRRRSASRWNGVPVSCARSDPRAAVTPIAATRRVAAGGLARPHRPQGAAERSRARRWRSAARPEECGGQPSVKDTVDAGRNDTDSRPAARGKRSMLSARVPSRVRGTTNTKSMGTSPATAHAMRVRSKTSRQGTGKKAMPNARLTTAMTKETPYGT